MNLSRRSLLTGLLSSAAVIAAGPVAKVIPAIRKSEVVFDKFGNRFEAYTSHFRWNAGPLVSEDWKYISRLVPPSLTGNVLDGGLDDPRALDWKLHLGEPLVDIDGGEPAKRSVWEIGWSKSDDNRIWPS
jgi:hypothetical protein